MDKQRKVFIWMMALFGVFISFLFYATLNYYFEKKTVNFTNYLISAEQNQINQGHYLSIIKRFQKLLVTSDFLKGVGIYDHLLSPLAMYGTIPDDIKLSELENLLETSHSIQPSIKLKHQGFLTYQTSVHIPNDRNIFFVFIFFDELAYYAFGALIIVLIIGFLILLAFSYAIEKQNYNIITSTATRTLQSIAHDIRAPFAKVNYLLSSIKETSQSPAVKENIERIEIDMERSLSVVKGLLNDLYAIKKNQDTELSCDIKDTLENVLESYFGESDRYQIIRTLEACPPVQAHQERLARVIFNLVDNAIKHCNQFIWIDCKAKEGQVYFTITNDGQVIPRKDLKNIFKPFQSNRFGGTGLGLFICKSIIESYEGAIFCEASSNDTKFTFTLPIQTKDLQATKKTSEPPHQVDPSNQWTIAVIDDEEFFLQHISAELQKHNIETIKFTSTDEFLLWYKNQQDVDLNAIVVDRYGPGFDAIEDQFAQSCRDFGYAGPVILYTSSAIDASQASDYDLYFNKEQLLPIDPIIQLLIGSMEQEKNV